MGRKPRAIIVGVDGETVVAPKGATRSGGSYVERARRIAVWNTAMDEYNYASRLWSRFVADVRTESAMNPRAAPVETSKALQTRCGGLAHQHCRRTSIARPRPARRTHRHAHEDEPRARSGRSAHARGGRPHPTLRRSRLSRGKTERQRRADSPRSLEARPPGYPTRSTALCKTGACGSGSMTKSRRPSPRR